ncbi:MAG: PIN domain-containing protein [Firmicutes bacterium]|nr:PIN domain-containing protein [Bacillota bacterium]
MVLVDTSVIIDSLKGAMNDKVLLFKKILQNKIPYGISAYTYQEILQGAKDEHEFTKLKLYLSSIRIFLLPEAIVTYEKAAALYFNLRRRGVTPRSVLDILIALTAIENGLYLLHNDKDFDVMSKVVAELKTLSI